MIRLTDCSIHADRIVYNAASTLTQSLFRLQHPRWHNHWLHCSIHAEKKITVYTAASTLTHSLFTPQHSHWHCYTASATMTLLIPQHPHWHCLHCSIDKDIVTLHHPHWHSHCSHCSIHTDTLTVYTTAYTLTKSLSQCSINADRITDYTSASTLGRSLLTVQYPSADMDAVFKLSKKILNLNHDPAALLSHQNCSIRKMWSQIFLQVVT